MNKLVDKKKFNKILKKKTTQLQWMKKINKKQQHSFLGDPTRLPNVVLDPDDFEPLIENMELSTKLSDFLLHSVISNSHNSNNKFFATSLSESIIKGHLRNINSKKKTDFMTAQRVKNKYKQYASGEFKLITSICSYQHFFVILLEFMVILMVFFKKLTFMIH